MSQTLLVYNAHGSSGPLPVLCLCRWWCRIPTEQQEACKDASCLSVHATMRYSVVCLHAMFLPRQKHGHTGIAEEVSS